MHSFEYDLFQQKAIDAINKNHSCLVSAPTGTGKTAIAEYAIHRALSQGQKVIFTAPIKAISNQKYRDFNTIFPGQVGILTGDISIEPHSKLLIMTTEIYRNQLFETPERHDSTAWAIFDEVHFLDDYERGTVWEEALMFSRPNTRIVALSATAPNIQELADWIHSIHKHPIEVVTESKRPVKLLHQFQCQNSIMPDLRILKSKGFMGKNRLSRHGAGVRKFHRGRRYRNPKSWNNGPQAKQNRIDDLLRFLIADKKLPCLYFAFGRKRVEELAESHTHFKLLNKEEQEENVVLFDKLAKKYSLGGEKSASHMRMLVERGIAYHHAGLLPTLKEVVEQLFTSKRIQLIFTTETFALGINMPARTVVFDELRKFYGFGFDNLTTRDYFQMAGRAGRRGLDKEGYVFSRINPHLISWDNIHRMVMGKPEPIMSQFNASYATLLSLYKQLGMKLLDVYPQSFHYFQSNKKKHKRALLAIERKINLLTEASYIDGKNVTDKGEFAMWIHGYELMLSELWNSNFLDGLNATELCVLLSALVYEPRKNEHHPALPKKFISLDKVCRNTVQWIHRLEEVHHVFPLTKKPHFHLAQTVEAWMEGLEFHKLHHFTDVDEGILIRYFRMITQILRQLQMEPNLSDQLKKTIKIALPTVKRDIVDAEKLLRMETESEKDGKEEDYEELGKASE